MRRPALTGAGMPTRRLFGRGHPGVRGAGCGPQDLSSQGAMTVDAEPSRSQGRAVATSFHTRRRTLASARACAIDCLQAFRRAAPRFPLSRPTSRTHLRNRLLSGAAAADIRRGRSPSPRLHEAESDCARRAARGRGTGCLSARPPWPRVGAGEPVVRAARKDPPEPLPQGAACGNAACWDVCAGRERRLWGRRGSPATR